MTDQERIDRVARAVSEYYTGEKWTDEEWRIFVQDPDFARQVTAARALARVAIAAADERPAGSTLQ